MLRYLALFALVSSLSSSSSGLALAADPPPATTEVPDVPSTFRSDSSGELPPRVKASGIVFRTIAWSDGKGDNLAVFSTRDKSRTRGQVTLYGKAIFVDVYAGKNGKLRKVRTVREVVDDCADDLMNEFLDGSVGLTDLDRDGLGELIFAYRFACRKEMAPADMKLVVLEGPKQYALVGKTRLHRSRDQTVGGEFTPRFDGAPPELLELAKKVWNKFVAE